MNREKELLKIIDTNKELFVAVPISLIDYNNLTLNEYSVWIALKSFCIQGRMCWPSRKTLAKKSRISTATLNRTLFSMENKGLLVSLPNFDEKGAQTSSTYYLADFNSRSGKFDIESLDIYRKKKRDIKNSITLK